MPTPHNDEGHTPRPAPAPAARPNRALYNPVSMAAYTALVIHGSHKPLWGIDNEAIHDLYARYAGPAHADVGVGNGYFLRQAVRRSATIQRLELLDLNPAPLAATRRRLRRRVPRVHTHVADALGRWPLAEASVDSVGSTMMLHTLPGQSYQDKYPVFAEAARVLRVGGVFFGCSVLGEADPAPISAAGARMRAVYNHRRNIFHNAGDTDRDLLHLLGGAFGSHAVVHVRTVGAVVLWEVTKR